jgi:hypothetical protein
METKYSFKCHFGKHGFCSHIHVNSIKEAKKKARYNARIWNKHLTGRGILEDEYTGKTIRINLN